MAGSFLVAVASAQGAEWRLAGSSYKETVFIDAASMVREGAMVKAWSLHMLKQPSTDRVGNTYFSVKALDVYDCARRMYRLVQSIQYDDRIGKGNVVTSFSYSEGESQFTDVAPDTVGEQMHQAACGR